MEKEKEEGMSESKKSRHLMNATHRHLLCRNHPFVQRKKKTFQLNLLSMPSHAY